MKNTCSLAAKHCVPCKGGVPPMEPQEAQKLMKQLKGSWEINGLGHLYKRYKFKNFVEAMAFANKISLIAESEGHHPDLTISWGACTTEIWTHKINGLTENDFILAAKIETIN